MKFRVWATVVEAFDYCWRERRAMVHFGWIPVGITLAVAMIKASVGSRDGRSLKCAVLIRNEPS